MSLHRSRAHNGLTRLNSSVRGDVSRKACRRVVQALEHDWTCGATGTYGVCECQERVVPHAQPHQATWALRVSVSVPPSRATHLDVCLEGVPECCSGARARRDRRRHWYVCCLRVLRACRATRAASPSHVDAPSESECAPIARSQRPRMCLAGVPECCSGARARRDMRCHWFAWRV